MPLYKTLGGGGGGGSSVTIGDPVVGGDKHKHLYIDGNTNLEQSPFYYEEGDGVFGFNTQIPDATVGIVGSQAANPGVGKLSTSNLGGDSIAAGGAYSGPSSADTVATVIGCYITVPDASAYQVGDMVEDDTDSAITGTIDSIVGNTILALYTSTGNYFDVGHGLFDDSRSIPTQTITDIDDYFSWTEAGGGTGNFTITAAATYLPIGSFGLTLRFGHKSSHNAGGTITITPIVGFIAKGYSTDGTLRLSLDYDGALRLYDANGDIIFLADPVDNDYQFGDPNNGNLLNLSEDFAKITSNGNAALLLDSSGSSNIAKLESGTEDIMVDSFGQTIATSAAFRVQTTAGFGLIQTNELSNSVLMGDVDGFGTNTVLGVNENDGTITAKGKILLNKVITHSGTTGNQTINASSGSVNFAAAASSLTVTNDLATADSIINISIATNDGIMTSVWYEATAGAFTIYANNPPISEAKVTFSLTN